MAFIHFHGYTSGIKDPDVFDVPDICDTQAMSNWVSNLPSEHIIIATVKRHDIRKLDSRMVTPSFLPPFF